jgi:Arc/MetJ family transcription regulator
LFRVRDRETWAVAYGVHLPYPSVMARQLTITVDDDFAATVEEEARRAGTSVDETVVAAVKRGLRPARPRYQVQTFDLGPPKINIDCTAAALEYLDAVEANDPD